MLTIKNNNDMAEIYISGNIIDDADGSSLSNWSENTDGYEWPARIRHELEACRGKALTIYINSDGGSIAAGVAIANMVKRHDAPTTAIVDGWCCSIATQIFFAARTRKIPKNAYLMIHKPVCCWLTGNAYDLRKTADILDTIQRGMESVYADAAASGVTADKIHELVEAETWLTGEEAAEYFDVDLEPAMQMAAVAGSKNLCFHHIPAPLSSIITRDAALQQNRLTGEKNRVQVALALAKGVLL